MTDTNQGHKKDCSRGELIAKLRQRAIELENRTGDPMGGTCYLLNEAARVISDDKSARWELRVPGEGETSFFVSHPHCPGHLCFTKDAEGRWWQIVLPPLPEAP